MGFNSLNYTLNSILRVYFKFDNSIEELKTNIILVSKNLKNTHNLTQNVHNNLNKRTELYM